MEISYGKGHNQTLYFVNICIITASTLHFVANIINGWLRLVTCREAVSGNKNARRGPFKRFKCIRKTAVTVLLGGAANR